MRGSLGSPVPTGKEYEDYKKEQAQVNKNHDEVLAQYNETLKAQAETIQQQTQTLQNQAQLIQQQGEQIHQVEESAGGSSEGLQNHIDDTTAHPPVAKQTEWDSKVKCTELSGVLTAAGWNGTEIPYTQTLTVSGVKTATKGSAGLAENATHEQYQAAVNAMLRATNHTENKITISAYGVKPTIDIPITITVFDT